MSARRNKLKSPCCNVCGVRTADYCGDCEDELGMKVRICSLDKCRAEHVTLFHRPIKYAYFADVLRTGD